MISGDVDGIVVDVTVAWGLVALTSSTTGERTVVVQVDVREGCVVSIKTNRWKFHYVSGN